MQGHSPRSPLLSSPPAGGSPSSSIHYNHPNYGSANQLPLVPAGPEQAHSRVRTWPLTLLLLLLLVADAAQVWTRLLGDARLRYVVVQSGIFVLFNLGYALLHFEHRRLLSLGFVYFHAEAARLARAAYLGVAVSVVAVADVFVFWPGRDDIEHRFSEANTLDVLVTAETVLVGAVLLRYGWICWEHNSDGARPDALHVMEDLPPSLVGQGLRPSPGGQGPLVRKQAGMILFLEERVRSLTQELLRAQRAAESQQLGTPHAFSLPSELAEDQGERLAEKDQEIRALRVEHDHMQQEISRQHEELHELEQVHGVVRAERDEARRQADQLKGSVSRQAEDIGRLLLLLESQKQANSELQERVDQLQHPDDPRD